MGKLFVRELARLFLAYAEGTTLESIALTAAMTMPSLLLQKPHRSSKVKEHIRCLECRLKLWTEGDLDGLLREGRTIQRRLPNFSRNPKSDQQLARSFAKLMMEGKVKAALRLISRQNGGPPLALDEKTEANGAPMSVRVSPLRDLLKQKHPEGKPVIPSTIDPSNPLPNEPHPVIFEQITGELVHSVALKTEGAAGPSGIDAQGWRRLCSSFQQPSSDLCNALAGVCKRICSTYVDPNDLSALVACRLIALNKCPGVRPIGIGEVVRRILGKVILATIGKEIQDAAGALQLCAGQQTGCEAAVHAMRELSNDPDTEAILLVDASNAFNLLNRKVALLNILRKCPSLAKVLVNTYRHNPQLFVDGEVLLSQEGTTQGDPLAMAMYAIGIIPLIHRLDQQIKQVWYADDASAGGSLHHLHSWWNQLLHCGPDYGYFANASKTWLIVKQEHLPLATELFADSGVQITVEGRRHLGAALGTESFTESYVKGKVQEWVEEVTRLSRIATSQPHAAYAALTHGLLSKWLYLLRTVPDVSNLFHPVEEAIRHSFLPALTGRTGFNDLERNLLELPARLGGLGIMNPSRSATIHHCNSRRISAPLTTAILKQEKAFSQDVNSEQLVIKQCVKKEKRRLLAEEASRLHEDLPPKLQRAMNLGREKGASSWLVTLPIEEHNFALPKGLFRDALCLRYGWTPPHLPSHCVCGSTFSTEHALSCPCGGLPSIRHNNIRDFTAKLLTEVCPNVEIEPALQPLTGERLAFRTAISGDEARLDVRAQGFWGDWGQCAFFDVRVFNPFAPSNSRSSLNTTYRYHESLKRRSYEQRVREVEHGSFTPLVFSATGGMAPAATVAFKRLASLLADKRQQTYNKTISWLRCSLSFSLVRSAVSCLRGARSSFHHPFRSDANVSMEVAISEGRVPSI